MALINAMPMILSALFTQLIPGLLKAVAEVVLKFFIMIGEFIRDVFIEIGGFIAHPFNKSKRPVTKTFGDTPEVMRAGWEGAVAGFKGGDYFAAAQNPMDLLTQAISAVGSMKLRQGEMDLSSVPSLLESLVGGVRQGGSTGGMQPLLVNVTAEGRTLDSVLYTGEKRGTTPRLTRLMKRTAQGGAHVGFYRGRYAPAS